MDIRMDEMRCAWIIGFICTSAIVVILMVSTPAASEWKDFWGDPGNVNSVDGTGELSRGQVRYEYVNETLWLPPLICDVSDDAYPEIIRFHYDRWPNPDIAWIEVIDHRNEVLKAKILLGYNREFVPSFGVANPGTANAIIYCMDADGVLYLYAGRDGSLLDTVDVPDSGGSRGFFKAFDTDGDGFDEIFGVTQLNLFRVDTRTGDLQWVNGDFYRMPFAFGTYNDQSVIVARLYLTDESGQQDDTAIVSTSNGEVLHVFRSDINVLTRVVVTDIDFDGNDEFIYVTNARTLRAIDLLTMDVDWSIDLSGPTTDTHFAIHIDTEGKRSWIVTSQNTSLYDGSNGALLDTYLGELQTLLIGHFDGGTDDIDTVLFDPGTKKVQILFDHEHTWDVLRLGSSPSGVSWSIPYVYTCDIDLDGDVEVVFTYMTMDVVGYAIIDSGREPGYEVEIEPREGSITRVLVEHDSFKLNATIKVKPDGRLPALTRFGLSFDGLELHYVHHLYKDDVLLVSADIPDDLYRLDHTVTVSNDAGIINITLTFQALWGWTETRPASMDFVLTEHGGYTNVVNFEDVFYVEPDIHVLGPILLHTPEATLDIAHGDTILVRNLSVLSVSGLQAFHENGPLLTVLPAGWNVSLIVDDAVFAISPSSRFSDDISFPFPDHDIDGVLRVEIGLTSLPNGTRCVSTFVFYITVDHDPPSFEGVFPENGTWFSESDVTIAVLVQDTGYGLDGGEVHLRITPGEDVWVQVPTGPAGENTWYCSQVITLSEGWNEITWRAMDTGGNGPTYSDRMMVGVDLDKISFTWSNPVTWVNSTDHRFAFGLEDPGGSGIVLSSIEYRYSNDGLFNFTPWTSLNLQGVEDEHEVDILPALVEGRDQFIQLKAQDVAGNVAHSKPVHFNVDYSKPTMKLMGPDLTDVLEDEKVTFLWQLEDGVSGLGPDSFEYRFRRGSGGWSSWKSAGLVEDPDHWNVTFDVSFDEGRENRFQARCTDLAGNVAVSEIIEVLVNSAPIVKISSPKDGQEVTRGAEVRFDSQGSVDIDDADVMTFTWISDIDGIIGTEASFSISDLSIGKHRISLFIDDQTGHNASKSITISVFEEPTPADDFGWYYIMLIAVLSVAVISFYLKRVRRREMG